VERTGIDPALTDNMTFGLSRFDQFQGSRGISANSLARRLGRLKGVHPLGASTTIR
jgi:hypothetical protein